MAKHTDGPWSIEGEQDMGRGRQMRIRAKGKAVSGFVAFISSEWPHQDQRAEQEANAQLIAAAPDLLEMVRRYASECVECGDGHADDFDPKGSECPECADIRALIAKAGG